MATNPSTPKVAIIVQTFPKLSETFVRRQATFLSAVVICERFDQTLYDRLGLDLSCHVIKRQNPLNKWLRKAAFKLGSYFDHWDSKQRQDVASFLKQEKIDVVLAQFGPNGIKVAPVCATHGIPLVIHFHGYDLSRLLRHPPYPRSIKVALRVASYAVVVNDLMRRRLIALGFFGQKIRLIPCGVDLEGYAPKEKLESAPCKFLAVGRMAEKKAPLLTIKAFERCAQEVSGVRLEMIGDGPLFDDVKAYILTSAWCAQIDLLGPRSHSEVKEALKNADVFLQHSVTASTGDEEGWPVSIAEAAASGLPVVSTHHSGIPMQVLNGKTGFLVEEGDHEAMGDRMVRLARDAALRRRLGRSARQHIEEHGNLRKSLTQLEQVLTDSIEKERSRFQSL